MLQDRMLEQMQVFNVGEDCPVFSQMFQFCQVRESLAARLVMLAHLATICSSHLLHCVMNEI